MICEMAAAVHLLTYNSSSVRATTASMCCWLRSENTELILKWPLDEEARVLRHQIRLSIVTTLLRLNWEKVYSELGTLQTAQLTKSGPKLNKEASLRTVTVCILQKGDKYTALCSPFQICWAQLGALLDHLIVWVKYIFCYECLRCILHYI